MFIGRKGRIEFMERKDIPNEIMLKDVSELIAEGHEVEILTKGCSMLPFIVGEMDSVVLSGPTRIEVGDVVLAMISPGTYVLHRVKEIDGEAVTLKGDGNLVGTERCTMADIKGLAVKVVGPSGREKNCHSDRSKRIAGLWNAMPYFFRRCFLGFYRRALVLVNRTNKK